MFLWMKEEIKVSETKRRLVVTVAAPGIKESVGMGKRESEGNGKDVASMEGEGRLSAGREADAGRML